MFGWTAVVVLFVARAAVGARSLATGARL